MIAERRLGRTWTSMSQVMLLGCLLLLASGTAAAGNQNGLANGPISAPGALGPITPNGPWFEFAFTGVGVPATGCAPADPGGPFCIPSSGGNSVFADAPPWTFTAPSAGATLTVTDAFLTGDVFTVLDFGVPIGTTSAPGADDCGDDPAICVTNPAVSSGVFNLGPGPHSITITPAASPFDGGVAYFRVDAAAGGRPVPTLSGLGLLGVVLLLGAVGSLAVRRTATSDPR